MSDQPRPQAGAPVAFGAQVVPPLSGHASQVNSVVCGVVDGRPVAITGGGDGTVRVWDMACHRQIGLPLSNRRQPEMVSQSEDEVRGVAYGLLEGQPVAVSVAGTTITVWDLVSGRHVGETIESEPVRAWTPSDDPLLSAVACTEMNKRLIAVTGGFEVRMWDVAEGKQVGKPMFGHGGGWIVSVACGVVNGRPIAVTASEYGSVLVWDLLSQEQIGQPLPGSTSVAYGVLDGRPIVVCVNHGGRTLQAWDLHSRRPVGRPLTGHTSQVRAVALGATGGRLVAVGGDEETLRGVGREERPPLGRPVPVRRPRQGLDQFGGLRDALWPARGPGCQRRRGAHLGP
jgi:WD40 repeat protein